MKREKEGLTDVDIITGILIFFWGFPLWVLIWGLVENLIKNPLGGICLIVSLWWLWFVVYLVFSEERCKTIVTKKEKPTLIQRIGEVLVGIIIVIVVAGVVLKLIVSLIGG